MECWFTIYSNKNIKKEKNEKMLQDKTAYLDWIPVKIIYTPVPSVKVPTKKVLLDGLVFARSGG